MQTLSPSYSCTISARCQQQTRACPASFSTPAGRLGWQSQCSFGGTPNKLLPAVAQSHARSSRNVKVMAQAGADGKINVLFVCLGNICRSPSAEAVFKQVVQREGLADRFFIDSCGTGVYLNGGGNPSWYKIDSPGEGWSYHEGNQADPRMRKVASRRGVDLTSRSRPLTPADFSCFDYIIGMDASNITAIQTAASYWASDHTIPSDYRDKVKLMTDYLRANRFSNYKEVPDPYFAAPGQEEGFELVLDLLDDACEGFLEATGAKQ